MVDDAFDEALGLEVGDGATGERAVDLHSVDQGRLGDDAVRRDFLDDAVAVEADQIRSWVEDKMPRDQGVMMPVTRKERPVGGTEEKMTSRQPDQF